MVTCPISSHVMVVYIISKHIILLTYIFKSYHVIITSILFFDLEHLFPVH